MNPTDDHFSALAKDYASGRPLYPQTLFHFLLELTPARELAWDCATGNGQAVEGLAPYFTRIIATDISQPLLDQATRFPNVTYQLADASNSGLPDHSVDLLTVAQALHWFDLDTFWHEVDRVLKPGAVFAFWGYNWPSVNPAIDGVFAALKQNIASYWPTRSALLHNEYRDVVPPFAEIATPEFTLDAHWHRETFLAHIRSWSGVRYKREKDGDAFYNDFAAQIGQLWNDEIRRVTWPMVTKTYRK